jgi:hypothetical protein
MVVWGGKGSFSKFEPPSLFLIIFQNTSKTHQGARQGCFYF